MVSSRRLPEDINLDKLCRNIVGGEKLREIDVIHLSP